MFITTDKPVLAMTQKVDSEAIDDVAEVLVVGGSNGMGRALVVLVEEGGMESV